MKKINWKTKKNGDRKVFIGAMLLECESLGGKVSPTGWMGSVSLLRGGIKVGPIRKSPEKAMEDAVELGREMMEDYSVALAKISKRLGSNGI